MRFTISLFAFLFFSKIVYPNLPFSINEYLFDLFIFLFLMGCYYVFGTKNRE